MNILSIQSWVAYGHVGNAAALFPLQRLGAEVWAINTVQFSNHTGYGSWTGDVFTEAQIAGLIAGIEARGVLPDCDAVLSGYMGDASIGAAIVAAAGRVRVANGRALYCCDPVIGDVGRGVFVRPNVPEFMRDQAVPAADIVTPNQFELEWLTGQTVTTLASARVATAALRARGPGTVLVTSLRTEETPADALDMLASDAHGDWLVRMPLLPIQANGAGDATAAIFLFHMLAGRGTPASLAASASSVWGLLRRTAEARSPELRLVAAQDEFVTPSRNFTPVAC